MIQRGKKIGCLTSTHRCIFFTIQRTADTEADNGDQFGRMEFFKTLYTNENMGS